MSTVFKNFNNSSGDLSTTLDYVIGNVNTSIATSNANITAVSASLVTANNTIASNLASTNTSIAATNTNLATTNTNLTTLGTTTTTNISNAINTEITARNTAINNAINNGTFFSFNNTKLGVNLCGGSSNVAIGYGVLNLNNYTQNIAVGINLLNQNIGRNNVAIGWNSGISSTTSESCTIIGSNSANSLTTGTYNTFLGWNSGGNATTNTYCLFLGSNTSVTDPSYNSSTAVGCGSIITASNQLMLGSTTTSIYVPNLINFSYSSIPSFVSSSMGYTKSITSSTTLAFVTNGVWINPINLSSLALGVYSISYNFTLSSTAAQTGYLLYGLSTSLSNVLTQNNSYYNIGTTSNTNLSISNTIVLTVTTTSNIYLNLFLNNNNTSSTTISFTSGSINATRLA